MNQSLDRDDLGSLDTTVAHAQARKLFLRVCKPKSSCNSWGVRDDDETNETPKYCHDAADNEEPLPACEAGNAVEVLVEGCLDDS